RRRALLGVEARAARLLALGCRRAPRPGRPRPRRPPRLRRDAGIPPAWAAALPTFGARRRAAARRPPHARRRRAQPARDLRAAVVPGRRVVAGTRAGAPHTTTRVARAGPLSIRLASS